MKKRWILLSLTAVFLFVGAGCVSVSSNTSKTTGAVGMYVSSDRGDNWQIISNLATAEGIKSISNVNIYKIFTDPQDSQAMYLATRENGLYYTYDGGRSWQKPASSAVSSGFIYSIAVHPQDKCTIMATNGRQVFKTVDCNRTWEEVYRESRSNVLIYSLAYNYATSYRLYLAESNGDVLQTSDGGNSWSVAKRFGNRLIEIQTDKFDGNVIYVVTRENGLYRSEDEGTTWVSLQDKMKNFSGSSEYRRFVMSATTPNKIYWISTYGVLVSMDRGNSWQAMKLITPPGSADIYGFAVNPKNENEIYYTATINSRSTFYKSIDGGENWVTKKLPSGQLPVAMLVHPEKDNLVYLGFTVPPQTKSDSSNVFFNN